MPSLRPKRLSPSGLQEAHPTAPAKAGGARKAVWAALGLAVLLVLAWFEGGEEPLHPITQDVALPENGQ